MSITGVIVFVIVDYLNACIRASLTIGEVTNILTFAMHSGQGEGLLCSVMPAIAQGNSLKVLSKWERLGS